MTSSFIRYGCEYMIIVEGIDGTGKTSLAERMKESGFESYHLTYEEKSEEGYLKMLNKNTATLILDRSFISELVYGPILRNTCKINLRQTKNIIQQYRKAGTKVIYLKSNKLELLKRRGGDEEDIEMLNLYFEKLNSRYDMVMNIIGKYMPVLTIDTSINSPEETIKPALEFTKDSIERE